MIETALFTLRRWGLILLAVVATLLGAYAAGGRAARRSAELDSLEDETKRLRAVSRSQGDTIKGVRDVSEHVSNLPSGGARDELRRDWMRDKD